MKLKSNDNIEESLIYYKNKIDLAFNFEKFSMKNARQSLNDFKKISKDEKYQIEMMVYYIERATEFEKNNGDMWEEFYTVVENMFSKVISNSCQGWGHRDILEEMIEDLEI